MVEPTVLHSLQQRPAARRPGAELPRRAAGPSSPAAEAEAARPGLEGGQGQGQVLAARELLFDRRHGARVDQQPALGRRRNLFWPWLELRLRRPRRRLAALPPRPLLRPGTRSRRRRRRAARRAAPACYPACWRGLGGPRHGVARAAIDHRPTRPAPQVPRAGAQWGVGSPLEPAPWGSPAARCAGQ